MQQIHLIHRFADENYLPGEVRRPNHVSPTRSRQGTNFTAICAAAIVLLTLSADVQCANMYCMSGRVVRVDISSYESPNLKLFSKPYDPSESQNRTCRWEIFNSDGPKVLGLSGFDAANEQRRRLMKRSEPTADDQAPAMQYRLEGPVCTASESPTTSLRKKDEFHVVQLAIGYRLIFTFKQKSSALTQLPPGLMVEIVEPGFCSREMVSYGGLCHRKSRVKRSLMEELGHISRDSAALRLASFTSAGAIQEFMEASKLSIFGSGDDVRSKVPLDLSQPVRIGLFYDKQDGSILHLSCRGRCQLNRTDESWKFNFTDLSTDPTHACGSLRADQSAARGILEFRNCNESLPALISFADTPGGNCGNSTEPLFTWLRASGDSGATQRDVAAGAKGYIALVVAASVSSSILIIAALSVLAYRLRRGGQRGSYRLTEHCELFREATV